MPLSTYGKIIDRAKNVGRLHDRTEWHRRYGSPMQVKADSDQETTAYSELLEAVKNSLSLSELIRLTLAKVGAIQAGREKLRRSDLHAGIGALPTSATLLAGLTSPPGFLKES
jgi:hypothetical protein